MEKKSTKERGVTVPCGVSPECGHCSKHGPPVPQSSGSHEAETLAAAGIWAVSLRRVRPPESSKGAESLRNSIRGVQLPGS